MNKNTKQKSKFKYKGVILGTSQPIVVKPLKPYEKKVMPSQKPNVQKKTKAIRKWKLLRTPHSLKKLNALKASQKQAKVFGTAMAQPTWGKGIFTGIYSGGGIETNRRKH